MLELVAGIVAFAGGIFVFGAELFEGGAGVFEAVGLLFVPDLGDFELLFGSGVFAGEVANSIVEFFVFGLLDLEVGFELEQFFGVFGCVFELGDAVVQACDFGFEGGRIGIVREVGRGGLRGGASGGTGAADEVAAGGAFEAGFPLGYRALHAGAALGASHGDGLLALVHGVGRLGAE